MINAKDLKTVMSIKGGKNYHAVTYNGVVVGKRLSVNKYKYVLLIHAEKTGAWKAANFSNNKDSLNTHFNYWKNKGLQAWILEF